MAHLGSQKPQAHGVWALARRQHGVATHAQLLHHGLSRDAIKHRVKTGRLHRVHRGVYAVGRADLTRRGRWMAAVLSCGPNAVLSFASAAALWGLEDREATVSISLPSRSQLRRPDLRLHRVRLEPRDVTRRDAIPVTTPTRTLIDLATGASEGRLESAVNAADQLDLVDPETLREEIAHRCGQHGVPALRQLLDHHTFALTDSELERHFLRLVGRAELPLPETGAHLNGFKVDFLWRDLGLVIETDGLRYHRTAARQARDRRRDQAHAEAGLTTFRFTHSQVRYDPEAVIRTLNTVARRLTS